jgi:Ribbon-helix-helix protein, copG family
LTESRYYDTVMMSVMPKRRATTREGMVVTTIALPPDLHKRLAIAAIEDGAASAELIREAVAEWLDRRKRGKRGR